MMKEDIMGRSSGVIQSLPPVSRSAICLIPAAAWGLRISRRSGREEVSARGEEGREEEEERADEHEAPVAAEGLGQLRGVEAPHAGEAFGFGDVQQAIGAAHQRVEVVQLGAVHAVGAGMGEIGRGAPVEPPEREQLFLGQAAEAAQPGGLIGE